MGVIFVTCVGFLRTVKRTDVTDYYNYFAIKMDTPLVDSAQLL